MRHGVTAALRPSPHRGRDRPRREMIRDLFEEDVGDRRLAPEAKLRGGFVRRLEAASDERPDSMHRVE